MEVKVDFVRREVIKPDSPATHDRLQLSLMDFLTPTNYVSTIFFYKTLSKDSSEMITNRLKSSLSKTLSHFYPLAGRIQGLSINCNDEGAEFTEARTDLLLSNFLKNNLCNTSSFGEFLPLLVPKSAGTWPLLSVKVSFFGSGSGVAIGVAVSHKICDASSFLTFVQGWADVEKDVKVTTPHFAQATIFPLPDNSFKSPSFDKFFEHEPKCVTNRFVFESSKITELKRKSSSESVPIPTRVEAITSLIWRCARNASRSNSAKFKSTLLSQAVNLRLRIPSNVISGAAIGNLQSTFLVKKGAESEMEISQIVEELRKAKEGINELIQNSLHSASTTTTLGQDLFNVLGNFISEFKQDIDSYPVTSWCKNPFYEVDFGWGTPVWLGSALHTLWDNVTYILLMDSKDGEGVEAWVGLPEQDMLVFASDQDLLTYAMVNPPVLI